MHRLLEGHGLGRDDVLQRASLQAGEDRLVDLRAQLGRGQDGATPRAAEGLVGGEGDDVGDADRAGVRATGDEPRDVGDVEHQQRAHLVRDGPERLSVDAARVGRCTSNDHLRPVLEGEVAHLVEVDPLVARAQPVGDEVVEDAAGVDGRAVGEVAAMVQRQTEDGVARIEQTQVDGHVGVGAGVRLDVGVLRPEELLGPLDGQRLGLVDELVAAVVALARVALRVLVGEDGAGGAQDGGRGEVLAGDELDGRVLPILLPGDDVEDLVVGFGFGGPGHQNSSSSAVIWATRRA